MQRTNRMVLGLVAVFVLGGSLAFLGCSSSDNTTDVADQATAQSLLGGQSFTFADGTALGVTPVANVATPTTLAFNPTATRFAVSTATRRATGAVTYGSCILTVGPSSTNPDATGGGSNFPAGTGPQAGSVITLTTCQFSSDTVSLTITSTQGSATSSGEVPTGSTGFGS